MSNNYFAHFIAPDHFIYIDEEYGRVLLDVTFPTELVEKLTIEERRRVVTLAGDEVFKLWVEK